MSTRTVHLRVDVAVDGDDITGDVTCDGDASRHFSGRLGLITAIDDALASEPPERAERPDGNGPRPQDG